LICIDWVPVDTTDIPKFSYFLALQQINSGFVPRLDKDDYNDFFPITHCQPNDRRSAVKHRKKSNKGKRTERKKEKSVI
jgi:hypothetical protein